MCGECIQCVVCGECGECVVCAVRAECVVHAPPSIAFQCVTSLKLRVFFFNKRKAIKTKKATVKTAARKNII